MTANLCGFYSQNQTKLHNPQTGVFLVVGTRKQPTLTRPKYYLLQKHDNSYTYLSSLYPLETPDKATETPVVYQLDYLGNKYLLRYKNDYTGASIEIDNSPNNSSVSNNIDELGVNFAPTPKPAKNRKLGE